MKRKLTPVIQKHGRWYVAYIKEIPGVNTQGRTRNSARRNLAGRIKMQPLLPLPPLLPLLVASFPALAFCGAGIIELRSGRRLATKIGLLLPPLLGLTIYGFLLGLEVLTGLHPFSIILNENFMTLLWAVVACSGAFITFSRKTSSILMALGGLELVFVSIFFSKPLV